MPPSGGIFLPFSEVLSRIPAPLVRKSMFIWSTHCSFPPCDRLRNGGNSPTTFWQLAGNALGSKHVRHTQRRRSESYRYSNVKTTASHLKYRRSAAGKYLVVGAERPGQSILQYGRRGSGGLD